MHCWLVPGRILATAAVAEEGPRRRSAHLRIMIHPALLPALPGLDHGGHCPAANFRIRHLKSDALLPARSPSHPQEWHNRLWAQLTWNLAGRCVQSLHRDWHRAQPGHSDTPVLPVPVGPVCWRLAGGVSLPSATSGTLHYMISYIISEYYDINYNIICFELSMIS